MLPVSVARSRAWCYCCVVMQVFGHDRWPGRRWSQWERRLLRARAVMRQEGLVALIEAVAREYAIDRRDYLLYQHHHRQWPEGCFRPRLKWFEERFVADNEEADLLALDHEDFRTITRAANQGLESGAVAFCVYVGREVAHVAWLATSDRARAAMDRLGYEVHFDEGEAWTGAAWTAPPYRSNGLLTYSCHRRFEYLLNLGFETSRAAVERTNAGSHRATMRFEPCIYAVGRHWRVFGRRWWSQREARPEDCASGSVAGITSPTPSQTR